MTLDQQAFRDKANHPGDSNLLEIVAERCLKKYPIESAWPGSDLPWYTIKDCVQRLKEEAMKCAIFIGHPDNVTDISLTIQIRNKVFKTAPLCYKHVILTLLLNETGNPVSEVLDKVQQLGDLEEWNFEKKEEKGKVRRADRVSRKEMFLALLKSGMTRGKINGITTKKLWEIY